MRLIFVLKSKTIYEGNQGLASFVGSESYQDAPANLQIHVAEKEVFEALKLGAKYSVEITKAD